MGYSMNLLVVSAVFILLVFQSVFTSFNTILNLDVQARKHLGRIGNNEIISSDGKELRNHSSAGSHASIASTIDHSIAAANSTAKRSGSHGIGIIKDPQNLATYEKLFVLSKLRQVLGETIPRQYIVVLKNGVTETPQLLAHQVMITGAVVPFVYNSAIKGFAIKIPNGQVLNSILANPSVDFVEPDIKVQAFSQVVSTGYSRVGGPLSVLAGSHQQVSVNAGIAIIDTGIDLNHPDLNLFRQVTFVPGTSTANDDNGHGTAVAGIAAAKDDSVGVVGIAPGARLWAIKVLDRTGSGSISTIIEGIDYVTQNAGQIDAANLSFGCKCTSSALDLAINNSVAAGVTYVVAAGNAGEDSSFWSPASNPNVISVAAMADSDGKCGGLGPQTSYGPDDTLAGFSNFGDKVTIAAPGVNIYTTYIGSAYATLSGTSVAAPFVTGAVALYHSLHPGISPTQVRSALLSAGSTPATPCNGDGQGYFDNPHGTEPLLYIGGFAPR